MGSPRHLGLMGSPLTLGQRGYSGWHGKAHGVPSSGVALQGWGPGAGQRLVLAQGAQVM